MEAGTQLGIAPRLRSDNRPTEDVRPISSRVEQLVRLQRCGRTSSGRTALYLLHIRYDPIVASVRAAHTGCVRLLERRTIESATRHCRTRFRRALDSSGISIRGRPAFPAGTGMARVLAKPR